MSRYFGKNYTRDQCRREKLTGAAAATLLSFHGKADSLDKLLPLLRHSDAAVREQAIRNLGRGRHHNADTLIARCLQDPSPPVRCAACEALGMLRAHRLKSRLYDALNDPDGMVACSAAAALGQMGDSYGLSTVARYVCTPGRIRWEALRVFNQLTGNNFRINPDGLAEAKRRIKRSRKKLF